MSVVFAQVFFSGVDPAFGTILSFVTLLAGYLARPIGGIIFGHCGDRLGRKRMLLITMAVAGTSSALIGVLPTYAQFGVLAPTLLVGLRVLQGIAVGGDWGGSATISVEAAEEGKRGLTAAFANMGARAARSCRRWCWARSARPRSTSRRPRGCSSAIVQSLRRSRPWRPRPGVAPARSTIPT